MKFILSFLTFGIIFVVIITFFAAIAVTAITIYKPESMIGLLQHLVVSPTPVPTNIKGIGILGDSQSDEYRADDNRGSNYPSTTLNWVEILAKYRKINFGEWGIREEPRREGFEYNFARSAATTNSLLASGQHIGLAEYIKEGKVNIVVLFIGANDYAPYITSDGYQAIYNDTLTDNDLIRKRNRIVADIKTAIETLQKAGNVKILLIKIPDWGNNIGVQAAFPYPDQRNRVTAEVQKTNSELEKLADEKHIPTLNPNTFFANFMRESKGTKPKIGNITLERLLINNDPKNIFLNDGIHTGTIFNGLFANFVVGGLNSNFGTNIQPLSEKEILTAAGL